MSACCQGRRIDIMNGDREAGDGENVPGAKGTGHLIPGLPNDLVLRHVAPKLPWNAMLALTAVNRPWRTAIRSREVHRLKKRSSSTQTLVVIYCPADGDRRPALGPALYDVERREIYQLPPCPPSFEISRRCIVVLDGRLYVMGNLWWDSESSTSGEKIGAVKVPCLGWPPLPLKKGKKQKQIGAVLALDIVACHGVWALFPSSRVFGYFDICLPCDGKICVFDFTDLTTGVLFNPGYSEWSQIAEPPGNKIVQFRTPRVTNLNKEIFFFSTDPEGRSSLAYNAEAEDWQVIETAKSRIDHTICVMDGKLYRFHCESVEVYNVESHSWAHFQSISYSSVETGNPNRVIPFGKELLVLLEYMCGRIVRQSVGFGVEGQPFVWEDLHCSTFEELCDSEDSDVKLKFFESTVDF